MSGLADVLFLKRPEMLYGLVMAMVVLGAAFWILGHQLHRIFLTVVLCGIGLLTGWKAGGLYGLEGLNAILAVLVGGLLGAGVGYWLFRFWLGLLASGLITLILLSLYSWKIALPYLTTAASESRTQLMQNGVELAPGTGKNAPKQLPILSNQPSGTSQLRHTPMGQAYQELTNLLPRLSRAQYPDWQGWAQNLSPTVHAIQEKMLVIMPRLGIDIFMVGSVALIFGFVLVVVRPVFLDIAYTSFSGILLTIGGIALFLILKDLSKLEWVQNNALVSVGLLIALWLVGVGIQYAMVPAPPPPAEESPEEAEEAPEKDKPQGGKKKK